MPADNGRMWYGVGLDDSQFQATAKRVNRQFSRIGNTAEREGQKIDTTFRRIGAGVATYFGGRELYQFAKNVAMVRGEFQQLEVAFTTMLRSKSKADKLMSDVVKFAATTPYELKDVGKGAKQLLAFQVPAKQIIDRLREIGDLAAGVGAPLSDLVSIYGKVKAKGKLQAEEMNLFLERGIPLVSELAKKYNTTEQAIYDMASQGKIGFNDLQGVITKLTSEGGMFANLMDEQSKTITGQISNLSDAYAQMLNEIGQGNEGAISDAISGAKYLVENYEEVWKVIKVMIATYGTYKAALIAVAAAQKASIAAGNIKAWFELAKGIKSAKDAQVAFNLVSKANPMLLLASAIAGVVTALVLFNRESNAAAEAASDMAQNIDKETEQLEASFDALEKTKEGTDERRRAIEKINTHYGDYLDNMITEKDTAEELAVAYRDVKEAIIEASLEKSKEEFLSKPQENLQEAKEEFYKAIDKMTREISSTDQRGRFQAYIDQLAQEVKKTGRFSMNDVKDAFRAAQSENEYATVEQWKEAWRAKAPGTENDYIKDIISQIGGWDYSEIERQGNMLARGANEVKKAKSEFEKYASGYLSTMEDEGSEGGEGGAKTPELQSINQEIDNTKAKIASLKTDIGKLRSGETKSTDYVKDIETKSKSLKEAEKHLKVLLGERKEKAKSSLLKAQEGLKEEAEQMQFEIEQARIDAMKDGIEKTLAQNELNYKLELSQLRKHKEQRQKELKEAGQESDDSAYYSEMENAAYQAYQRANVDSLRAEKEKNELLLSEYESMLQKRERIKAEYEQKEIEVKEAGGTAENIAELQRQRDETLAEIDLQIANREATFVVWSEQLANMGLKQLKNALKSAEASLRSAKGKITDKERAVLRTQIRALEKRIEIAEARDSSQNASKSQEKKWGQTLEIMNEVQESVRNITSEFDGLDDATKTALSAAMNISAGVIGMITGIQTLAVASAQSIKAVEKASVILAIIGAAVQVMTALFKLFDNSEAEAAHEKAMQEMMERKIKQQHEYNLLLLEQKILMEEAASIFGEDSITRAQSQVDAYREAIELYNEALNGPHATAEDWMLDTFGNWIGSDLMDTEQGKKLLAEKRRQLAEGIAGISDIRIVTGSKTVKSGFLNLGKKQKDVYSGLLDVYPDLIDSENRLNVERAKAIMNTEKMSDADKDLLGRLIELEEQAKEAEEALTDYLSATFGDLGDGIMDSLTQAITAGTDAWEEFGDVGAEVLENLGKQIAYSLFFSESFKDLENKLKAIYSDTGKSDEEIAEESGALVEDFYNGIGDQMNDAQDFLEGWDSKFGSLDLWDGESRSGASKGFESMSQDSADELNGRFTALQAHTYAISEGMKLLMANSEASLNYLAGIEQNTSRLSRIESSLDEMNTKGLKLKA